MTCARERHVAQRPGGAGPRLRSRCTRTLQLAFLQRAVRLDLITQIGLEATVSQACTKSAKQGSHLSYR
jgi:hypothetical protein